MKSIEETAGAPKKAKREPKPVTATVTFTGHLAAEIRRKARARHVKPEKVVEWFCESGAEREPDEKLIRINVQHSLQGSLQRLAEAAGYEDGLQELGFETWLDYGTIINAVALSLIRLTGPNGEQVRRIAAIAMEETLRFSSNYADQWVAKNTLGLEVTP